MTFDRGCIIKIRMVNFMHYSDQTIRPMPGFNVVIGHNGSGKSAMVNAICIGLGGAVDTLQRCENITTFVKRDCEEARIEVELYRGEDEENYLVGCTISNRGKVSWTINGEKVNKTRVEELVASLNIQTNNMCQFLPQDVVKNFPLMTPQERFLSTVKAVGEGQLVEDFSKLKGIQKVIDDSDNEIATKENTLESVNAKLEAIASKKIKIDNIEQLKVSKELAEKKLKWVKFENDIKEAKKIKKEVDRVKEGIVDFKKTIDECKIIDTKKDLELSTIKDRQAVPDKIIRQADKTMADNPVSQKMTELTHVEQLIKSAEEDMADRTETIESAKLEIERINRELKHFKPEQEVDKEVAKLRDKEGQIENKVQTLVASKTDLTSKSKTIANGLKTHTKTLDQLKNAEQQKLNQLMKTNADCFGAVMHIRKHIDSWRAEGRFKSAIHEPAVLTLNVQDIENAIYVEKEVGSQQLEAFVCEDASEASDLMQELRAKFKRVSVIHGDMSKLGQFQEGGARYQARHNSRELSRYGFKDYVSDMFTGPMAVCVHLYMHTSVFTTAVFGSECHDSDKLGEMFPNMRKYYVGLTLNTCRVSKYSSLVSRGEEDVSYFKAQRLKVSYDQELILSAQEKVGELTKEKETTDKHIQKIEAAIAKNKEEISDIRKEITKCGEGKRNKQKMEITLKHKQELIEEHSKPKNTDEHETKMADYRILKSKITRELSGLLRSMQESHSKLLLQAVERDMLLLKQMNLEERYSENSAKLSNLQLEVRDQERLLKPLEEKLNLWKDRLRGSKDAAHGCTADESKEVSKKPPPNYGLLFDQIEANTVEDLEAHIEAQERELRQENKLIREQEKISRKYEELQASVETLSRELEELKHNKEEAKTQSEQISTGGRQKLKDLVEQVNDKFSAYFADLGYSGEVTLSKTDDTDYRSYGVAIKVRFRDNEEWSELSKGRQSGGEMSVTTAIYMLALQELTTVPFRCVDEINQGLDERNERRVWDMILNAATEGKGSQYFYLAPKMPYSLQYKPGTVVHVCHASDSIARGLSGQPEAEEEQGGARWVSAAKRSRRN